MPVRVRNSSNFCRQCSRSMVRAEKFAWCPSAEEPGPRCGPLSRENRVYCENCGQAAVGAAPCRHCGRAAQSP